MSNPRRRHRRRHFRSNPGMGRGLTRSITEGLKCGTFIVLGETVSGATAGFIPVLGNTGVIGALKIGLTGTLLGTFGRRLFGSPANAAYFIGGAWAKAIRTAVAPFAASIPLIGPQLSGYTPLLAAPSRMSGYAPRASGAGVSAADDGSGYVF